MNRSRKWFPGYTVAGVATLALLASAPGQTFIVSQLNTPLRETFGIEKLALNTSYTIATVLSAFPLVLVGALADRLGPRRMLALTAFVFGLGCMLMSTVTGLLTVFIGFFLLRFLGQGALALVSQHTLAMWFHRRLGSIHGLKQLLVFGLWSPLPAATVWLMAQYGWRETYMIFGVLIWLLVIPLALWLVRDKPEDLGLAMDNDWPDAITDTGETPDEIESESYSAALNHEPAFTLKQAARTRAYWTLATAIFLPPLIGTAFLFDMQPILMGRGMTTEQAALVVSAWTATMAIMAVPSGMLTDRFQPSTLLPIGMGCIALSAGGLMIAFDTMIAAIAMSIFAIGQSTVVSCAGATTARYFGRVNHGAIRSSLTRLGVVGTGLGPIFTGVSEAITDGYVAAMIGFIVMCVPVMILTLRLRTPGLQRDDP